MSQTVTPYLLYEDVAGALDWLSKAFGFRETLRFTGDAGYVNHAEMDVGDGSPIYLGDPGDDYRNPKHLGAATCLVHVYVDDVDAHHARAVEAGATIVDELREQEYGDRRYGAEDPEGHQWFFAQRITEVAPEEWGATVAQEG
ncbi:MAG: VOC family protein [Actinomycetota bacterium]|nr:VOC family protein [Actinomycetota bacterium]